MTTPDNGTALAVREFTEKQIKTRFDSGYGWKSATREQMNAAYLLAVKYDLDPLTDLALFRDQLIYTIDGRVRIMRRHPQYAGYETRPLTKEEKDAWGYGADEIVVECAIRTKSWGTIKARGKVTPTEFARQPVAKSHPQEMAEKRAIARASRMAFGQDVPDDEEVGIIIQERNDPDRVARNAAEYDRTIGSADWGERPLPQIGFSAAVENEAPEPASIVVTSKTDPLWKRWLQAERSARAAGVSEELLALAEGVKLGQVSAVSLEGACLQLESAAGEVQQPAQAELTA